MQQEQTVPVFLYFPVMGEDGRIDGIYPKANFSELISQVRICEPGYLKMVGVIMVVDALITRIKVAGLGKAPKGKKALNATGKMAQVASGKFDDRLRKFRCDRNVIVHSFLWKNTDGISEEIMKRSYDLMNDLLHHFLDFPVAGEDGRIDGICPKANFSELISQVRICEPGYLKMVGVIMVVDALITRIKVAGLGVASGMKDPSTKKTAPNATGEMARFDDRLRKFRCDRNVIVHDFLWKSTDGISEEILDRSCKLMDDLLHHFIEVRPDPDAPGAIAFRFPEIWNLETHPPGHGRNSKRNGY